MALIANALCTPTELEYHFGATALLHWQDHNDNNAVDGNESLALDDAINWASGVVFSHAGQHYTQSDLASSDMAKRWAISLAGYRLGITRGNPSPEATVNEYDRVIAELNEVVDCWVVVPGLTKIS